MKINKLVGIYLTGPCIIGSYYLSLFTIGAKGSLNTNKGKAKFTKAFLNEDNSRP